MKALYIVKQMVEDGCISQEVAEKYCPEIKKYKDEIVKKQILELIRNHSVNADRCMMENWVYSHALLEPFKPSDEQIDALVSAIDVMIDNRGAGDKNTILLSGLYHELKAL